MPTSLHSLAQREVKRVADDYDEARDGLGDEFLVEFEKALDIVEAHGAAMAFWSGDVRVVRLNRFPYGIYYRMIGNMARVLTVKHLHRDPDYGLDRT